MGARDNQLLDDIARVAGGAAGLIASVREQVAEEIKARFEDMADRMDLVPRADLDRMETRLAALEKRIATLEGGKGAASKKTTPKTAKKKNA